MKKKVLLISDDIRGSSGVSHIGKNLILNLSHEFDWVQLSAMRNHPEHGNIIDVSDSVSSITGVSDLYVRLYPSSGFGNEESVLKILELESPDVVLHISDPRNFSYLYSMDMYIRNKIPLTYYHVWDNDPIPFFNKNIYMSCDWIGCINKKTLQFVKSICGKDKSCSYIPHGVSANEFYLVDVDKINSYKNDILGDDTYDFVVFSNNVNIPRKQLPTLFLSMEELRKQNYNKRICLLIHINPSSVPSDNLKELARSLCPELDVVFSEQTLGLDNLNIMYNISDLTVNLASNEGFGLSTLESLMTGTPILANNTGGLSDQMHYEDGSIGEWAYSVEPVIRRLNSGGSVPYIYDDICSVNDVVVGLSHWLNMPKETRTEYGELGRIYANENFSLQSMIESISSNITRTITNHKVNNQLKIVKL
jgi:glycosyltransferase involved in cell wall biosynthesis